jgi:cell division protein FtsB
LVLLKKFVLPVFIGLAVYLAVLGGQYSSLDVRRIRKERDENAEILMELTRSNDSLRAWADSVELDSATIERLSRELYGMIRDGEILYRIAQPEDSVSSSEAR